MQTNMSYITQAWMHPLGVRRSLCKLHSGKGGLWPMSPEEGNASVTWNKDFLSVSCYFGAMWTESILEIQRHESVNPDTLFLLLQASSWCETLNTYLIRRGKPFEKCKMVLCDNLWSLYRWALPVRRRATQLRWKDAAGQKAGGSESFEQGREMETERCQLWCESVCF